MGESQPTCEICGQRTDSGGDQSYTRSGAGPSTVVVKGPKQCSTCGRRGCPSCLRVVEEQADDHFYDQYVCRDCLDEAAARPV